MTLAPLLAASPVIQLHVAAAVGALVLGLAQFAIRRGTPRHRLVGRLWVGLMAAVALTSFGISGLRQVGPFSWIHGLSVATLVLLWLAVRYARTRRVAAHRWAMIGLFAGGLVITGLFTLLPGRLMHTVLFGPPPARTASR
ncbi:MAG: DUF2306 domain-containing protein [Methylobacterium sp.]|uniref:DUF2306 domain-containing protein n=1 Tax=Methylobacterium sp. TaxID=409 RepID=UPI00258CBDEC|nr:DUF2306 domain-containing protein [Methylobacterium sp.]MBY0298227.1 DUF2306 domain-containing protein [Methylobacterium sp.]